MILIPINDKWRIRSDELNLILEDLRIVQKGVNAGKEVWEAQGYYPTFDALLCGLVRKHVIATDADTLKQIVESVKKIEAMILDISNKFTGYFLNKECNDCEKRS